jgi:hypothetical protein
MFYFHFEDGAAILDRDGVDLDGTAAAHAEAVATLADILRDGEVNALWDGKPLRLWVTDQPNGLGQTLFAIHITATGAVQEEGASHNVANLGQARREKSADQFPLLRRAQSSR